MAEMISCPSCGRTLRLPETLLGRQVQCPTCGAAFTRGQQHEPEQKAPVLAPVAPAQAPVIEEIAEDPEEIVEEEYDDRPRRRRRPRLRMDAEPERGGVILTLGILSVVIAGLSLCLGVLGIIPGVVGLGLGIAAWTMGHGDLKKMRQGVMDPRGISNTQTGRTLGIVGVCLGAFCSVAAIALIVFAVFGEKLFR